MSFRGFGAGDDCLNAPREFVVVSGQAVGVEDQDVQNTPFVKSDRIEIVNVICARQASPEVQSKTPNVPGGPHRRLYIGSLPIYKDISDSGLDRPGRLTSAP